MIDRFNLVDLREVGMSAKKQCPDRCRGITKNHPDFAKQNQGGFKNFKQNEAVRDLTHKRSGVEVCVGNFTLGRPYKEEARPSRAASIFEYNR